MGALAQRVAVGERRAQDRRAGGGRRGGGGGGGTVFSFALSRRAVVLALLAGVVVASTVLWHVAARRLLGVERCAWAAPCSHGAAGQDWPMERRPEPPTELRAALDLARREAARVARRRIRGESDLSAVFVACDHTRRRQCAAASLAAARVLQDVALHRYHILRNDGPPLVPEGVEALHQLRRNRFVERRLKLSVARKELPEDRYARLTDAPYAVFIAILDESVKPPPPRGWFNIAVLPPAAITADAVGTSNNAPRDVTLGLQSYEHLILADDVSLRAHRNRMRTLDPGGCWPTLSIVAMTDFAGPNDVTGRTAMDTLEQVVEDLITMCDVHLAKHALRQRWQFWQRLARDARARRHALCAVELNLPRSSTHIAVLADDRRDGLLATKAKQLMITLGPEWGLVVLHGEGNEQYVRNALEQLRGVRFVPILDILKNALTSHPNKQSLFKDMDPRSGDAYNIMWKSSAFWRALGPGVEQVLTWQSDVFLTGVELAPRLLRYDYVGAPWCNDGANSGYKRPEDRPDYDVKMLHNTRQIPAHVRVGNGGFSLRRVPVMIDLAEGHGERSPISENEDVFYVISLDEEGRYDVATPGVQDAALFAIENMCIDIPAVSTWRSGEIPPKSAVIPFGFHKPLYSLGYYVDNDLQETPEYALDVFDRIVIAAERGVSDTRIRLTPL